jgi:hypothetical protein
LIVAIVHFPVLLSSDFPPDDNGKWTPLELIQTKLGTLYFAPGSLHQAAIPISDDLLLQIQGKELPPHTLIRGWAYFLYPHGFKASRPFRYRATLVDVEGHKVSQEFG